MAHSITFFRASTSRGAMPSSRKTVKVILAREDIPPIRITEEATIGTSKAAPTITQSNLDSSMEVGDCMVAAKTAAEKIIK